MSKGSVIIDGVDIDELGMFILRGGDYDFLSMPARKEPEQEDWHEYDGVDTDLTEIYFNEKKITVGFHIRALTGDEFLYNLNRFHKLISAPGYRQIYSREFGKTFRLRYINCPAFAHKGGMYKPGTKRADINVEFSMDDPLQLFTGSGNMVPRNGRDGQTFVKINGRDLADFGIIVNQCYNTVLRLPAVKSPLTRSIGNRTGLLVYPLSKTTFETKQVVIDCTMTAGSRDDFYYNYEALFNSLTLKEAVQLSTFAADDESCYYSAMQDFRKLQPFSSRIMVQFSLVLTLTGPSLIEYLLSTEDGYLVVTEDGQYFIEV